jgi:peptide/nickel transport system substrate-binding protein
MSRLRWRVGALSLSLIAAVSLIAVGGGTQSGASTRPAASQTLTVAVPGDITNFNPYTDYLIEYRYVIYNTVFDPLVRYTPTLGVVPDLATSASSNANATVWTFKLRHVKFQDGEPFNAQAAIKSLKAVVAAGSIFGFPLATVKSYAAPSPYTLVVTLKAPYSAFLDGIAEIAMVAPNTLATSSKTPVGTGPFKFVSWTPNSQIVLARNDSYFGKKPSYQSLIFKPVTSQPVALTDLYAGAVDIVSNVSPGSTIGINKSAAKVVSPPTSNSLEMVEFNSSRGKIANPDVRRALAYALNKQAVNKIAYNSLGHPTWSPIPAKSYYYANETGYPYNLKKAKALLAKAGASHLNTTLILPTGYPDAAQMGRVWQQSLAQIGVTLNVDVQPLATWLTNYLHVNYDMTWNVFNASADPNSFFSIIMTGSAEPGFHDAKFFKLIKEGVSIVAPKDRAPIYRQLQAILVNQLPTMIVMRTPILSVASTKISGYGMNPLGWGLYTGIKLG